MHEDILKVLYSYEDIDKRAKELGKIISEEYKDKNPVFLCLLKGSISFTAKLMEYIDVHMELECLRAQSYAGTKSTGDVKLAEFDFDSIKNRDVLIIEDIIDTGITLKKVTEVLNEHGAKTVEICTLIKKLGTNITQIEPKYIGFTIENEFVVGFGLDFNEAYRNLPYIGVLKPSKYS